MLPPIVSQSSPHAFRQKQFETFVLSLAPTRCSVALSKVLLPSLIHGTNHCRESIEQPRCVVRNPVDLPQNGSENALFQQNALLPVSSVLRLESTRSLGFPAKSTPYLLLQPLNTSLPRSFRQVSRPVCNPSKSSAAASFLPAHGSPHSSPLPADTKSHIAT